MQVSFLSLGAAGLVILVGLLIMSLMNARKISLQDRIFGAENAMRNDGKDKDAEDGWYHRLETMLYQSRSGITPVQYMMIGVVAACVVYFIMNFLLESGQVAVLSGIAVGLFVPRQVLIAVVRRKNEKFDVALTKALKRMAAAMQAGSTLQRAVEIVRDDEGMDEVMREEMDLVLRDTSAGETLVKAFRNMADRTSNRDVKSVSISIGIALEKGSNLAEILETHVETIFDRAEDEQDAKATLAGNRTTVHILALLPFVFTAGIKWMSPDYFTSAFEYADGLGRYIFMGVYVFVAIGYMYMNNKCDVKL